SEASDQGSGLRGELRSAAASASSPRETRTMTTNDRCVRRSISEQTNYTAWSSFVRGYCTENALGIGMFPPQVSGRNRAAARRFKLESRGEQGLGVVGFRLGKHSPRRALLHHLAVTEHDDGIRKRTHDLQIVTDEKIGKLVAALQLAQKI